MRKLAVVLLVGMLYTGTATAAEEFKIGGNDTVQSVLTSLKGKRATVRVRSGQELSGTVKEINARVVHLGGLAGKEYFDAVVPLDAIDAVLVRTKN